MDNFNLKNYLYNNPLLNEEKQVILVPKTTDKEEKVVDFILGGEEINEVDFNQIRNKFGKALKKGAMTLGILAAVMASPKISQAQKAELRKDVTDSTWFLDQKQDFIYPGEGPMGSGGGFVTADDPFDDDYRRPLDMEKWVNNLGQDSTVYKYSKTWNPSSAVGTTYKTTVDKDVKPWQTKQFSQVTKKGEIGDYLWTKDNKTSITPDAWKAMRKMEKGGEAKSDISYSQAKKLMDQGFKSTDFQKIDLKNIDSPGKDSDQPISKPKEYGSTGKFGGGQGSWQAIK